MGPRLVVTIAGMLLVAVAPTAAQTNGPPDTPGGLFGTARSNSSNRNTLNLILAVSESLDSEPPPDLRARVPQDSPQGGGYSTTLIGSGAYVARLARAQVATGAQTAFRYYERLNRLDAVSYSIALGGTVTLPKRSTFRVNQTAAYSPSYFFSLFPTSFEPEVGQAVPVAPDYRVEASESYLYGTNTTFTLGSTRGHRVSVSADHSYTDLRQGVSNRSDLTTFAASGRYSHGVARNGFLSVAYQYHTSDFGFGGTAREHAVSIGAEYSRPLSARRRAILRLTVTPSTLDVPGSESSTRVSGRLYKLNGNAELHYAFHGTWRVGGNYRRRVEYVAVLGEPVFSDAARTELAGLVTRRINVSASAAYARGNSALTRDGGSYDTYTGNARFQIAITRSLALYNEYLYHQYDLRRQSRLAPDLPRVFDQHGIRMGLMLLVSPF